MKKSIFINIPWSKCPSNAISITIDQVYEMYELIIKAFMFKYKHENLKERNLLDEAQTYNLNNLKVFNLFVNENLEKVSDPVARDYVLETISTIRNNNFSKDCVKNSYQTIYRVFDPNNIRRDNIKTYMARYGQFIDFNKLFQICEKHSLSDSSNEILEIYEFYNSSVARYSKELADGKIIF